MKWTAVFPEADPRLVRKFVKYHRANPHVYAAFVLKAHQMRNSGRTKYSAWVIINIIRWDHDITTTGGDFKISNDFIALYARYLMHKAMARQPGRDGADLGL